MAKIDKKTIVRIELNLGELEKLDSGHDLTFNLGEVEYVISNTFLY